ncbi:G-protein coupled receptor Mth2 [Araneus ventricosus]|uniref:G-protein coupled receptor Mth2 n=1 Tax=Araneus ventricosus TaxID=182803 RepID=A0A4Y2ESK7_ARAVE|nr:G-protein coupled receptor Mth2 [Araneus ventricosus]
MRCTVICETDAFDMRRYAMHTVMNIAKRCVMFCLFFGHLICGVNHEKENTVSLHRLLLNDINNISTSSMLTFLKNTSSDDVSNGKRDDSKPQLNSSPGSFCSLYDSCVSRCNEPPRGLPFTCNCDSDCDFYSDCCVDMKKECGNDIEFYRELDSRDAPSFPKVTCELLIKDYPIFMVSNCSPKWKNNSFEKLCDTKITTECIFANSATKSSEFDDAHVNCASFVYHQCEEEVKLKCNETVEPLCRTLIKNHCTKVTSAKCQSCTKEFWPVFDQNQVLYRNSYCAMCNFEDNYIIAESKSLVEEMYIIQLRKLSSFGIANKISRKCFLSVTDFCPNDDNTLLSSLCRKTLGPVLSTSHKSHGTIYKNVYCALCRNESLNEMRCMKSPLFSSKNPIDPNMMTGMIKPLVMDFVTGITSDIQGLRLDDIPAAFSFLLNFGLDGRERVYISSEGDKAMKEHQQRCGPGYIWDPFSSICRKLHCSTEFVLVDYQCVRKDSNKENNSTHSDDINIPDASADFVHLTLVAEMELFDFLAFYKRNISEICDSIRESFSSSFNIKIDRIRNVSFNISLGNFSSLNETLEFLKVMDEFHPINFTIDFDLYEMSSHNLTEPEPSVDSIVSLMASALSVNGFDLGINNSTSRVYEIHQTVDFLKSWCNPKDGGIMKRYWNSEFKLILNDNVTLPTGDRIKGIYINKTGQFYPKGQFVADILYQGHQFNQNLINVSGLAVICDRKVHLNESCTRVILERDEYFITENGSLILNDSLRDKVIDDSVYEWAENDSIVVCLLPPIKKEVDDGYYLEMDAVQAYLSFALSWISVFAMIAVLVTYCIFSSLRNLPGCNTMNLTFSLLAMQITSLFGQRNTVTGDVCKGVSILLHYVILCCLMWMNIMAYDLYKTFGNKTVLNNIRSKGKYLFRYMLYAYGLPLLIVLTTALLDKYLEDSIFSPQYGKNNFCWITNKYAAAMYFATPLAVIMCVNFIFYLLTICSIRNVKHVLYLSNQKKNQRGKSDVLLYFRMALVIGLTWAFAFAAAYTKQDRLTGQILTYLFIISNTLQGVYIFAVFVCNRRVDELYREGIRKLFAKASGGPAGKKTFGGLMNALRRTVSTETVVSIVSNSSSCSNRSVVSTVSNSSSCSTHSGLETIKEVE